MKKLKFVVDICTFMQSSGGICALHQLCHELNSLGEECYITSPITHPTLNAPYVADRKFTKDEVVVIYPEITYGNPLQAKNVVRWVLNNPGDEFFEQKLPSDLLVKYSNIFKLRDESESEGILVSTFSDKLPYFTDESLPRNGSAYLIKKGGMKRSAHPDNSINLSLYHHDVEIMAKIFKRVEYFYCYDNVCFWPVLAALCGCTPVVIPNTDLTFEEWSSEFPELKYGIAYGVENIPHAKNTLHLFKEVHRKRKLEELEMVKNFINLCYNKFSCN
jgi:hypothetical protein